MKKMLIAAVKRMIGRIGLRLLKNSFSGTRDSSIDADLFDGDLAAAAGRPVFAPAAGTVREAAEDAYWGGVLIIDHEGWTTVLRCVTPRVEAGTRVQAGDFIASVAPAPAEAAEESHFHVEVEREGSSQDPKCYF